MTIKTYLFKQKLLSYMLHLYNNRSSITMRLLEVLVLSLYVGRSGWSIDLSFPPDFKFGVGTGAYQIEGAWNASDKAESVADRFTHGHPEMIIDQSTGDVACDSYHLWKRDVEIAAELGVQFYRFSISWPRLLPSGYSNHISEAGSTYYSNLIDGLLEKGVEPLVTLYHWDLPQSLQDLGGWTNPLVADWFADFARVAFTLYGSRVKTWLTLNEPVIMCDLTYSPAFLGPDLCGPKGAAFVCNKNVLLAHAKAWRLYDEEFRHLYHGRVSIANDVFWYEAYAEGDEELAELTMQYCNGRYSHPIYSKEGGWPSSIEKLLEEKSKKEGYPRSILPAFTKEEIEMVRGTYDFYGVNHYNSYLVRQAKPGDKFGLFPLEGSQDLNVIFETSPDWKPTGSQHKRQYPEGLRRALTWLKNEYGDMEFFITENGYASNGGLDDYDRIEYYREYLKQVLLSMKEDGVNVTGYSAWSLMDAFEWWHGYRLYVGSGWSIDLSFPPDFKFGVGTGAYQIEGGWNASDKGESIWDILFHRYPEKVEDQSTGDVACDSYHLWKRDVEIAVELGVQFYRFSISWPRLLPSGFSNHISEAGSTYYRNLIDGLLEKGVEPLVTLYHWDLPQSLHELGGWTNPLVVDWFADYARVAFTLYGSRVKTWLTLNEPVVMCDVMYTFLAPDFVEPEDAAFMCSKNMLLAHAKAWRLYDEEFRHLYHGQVSIANHVLWYEPYAEGDEELAELTMQHCNGRYSHPIYSKEGGWPPSIEKLLEEKSKKEGYLRPKLPAFTKEEIELVRGTYDFYGVNHYNSYLVRRAKPGDTFGYFPFEGSKDLNVIFETSPDWKPTALQFNSQYPEGLRRALAWLKNEYGDMEFLITENGYASNGNLKDYDRIEYYREYLKQLLLSIKEDGVNVTGYCAWSLMDNFEWWHGYRSHFGFYRVNFSDPMRTRTPRMSARYYREVIKSHSLDVPQDYIEEIHETTENIRN